MTTLSCSPKRIQDAETPEETAELMRMRLKGIVPDVEISLKADLVFEINRLKKERNAIILGHNYMEPALYYGVPDFTGDSLELARISSKTDAPIIVFCGVQFMAETAKVLNPEKTVLIPAEKAGCSLAEGITKEDVRQLKRRFPGAPVVSYVNTYADVKAESDYCCTSGNSSAVLRYLFDKGHEQVIFLPDEYLARNTAHELGAAFVCGWDTSVDGKDLKGARTVIGWKARCEVHELFTVEDVLTARRQFPDAIIIAHPECSPDVIRLVDVSGSTKKMVEYVRQSPAKRFILFTECSMGDNIAAENPEKEMVRLCSHTCPYMKLITLEDTLESLRRLQFEITLPEDVIRRARLPIDRMLEIR